MSGSSGPGSIPRRSLGPVLVLLLLALLAAAAASGVWHGVAHRTGIAADDAAVTAWAVDHRGPVATPVLRAVTVLAGTAASAGLAVLAALWLYVRTRSWTWPAIILGAMAAQAVLAAVLKVLTARPRPPVALELGAPARTFAFPSGHTLAGGTLALVVGLAVAATTAHRVVRVLAAALAITATVAVAASRVYLGYHWLTDVVTSGLLAVALTALCAAAATLLGGGRGTAGGVPLSPRGHPRAGGPPSPPGR